MPIIPLSAFLEKANSQDSPFDYLIVGGGTVGLVVAHRLTENSNITVGVIEAGVYHAASGSNPVINTPGYTGRTLNNPLYDWAFQSEPQPNARNQPIPLPCGKGLGGSSLINYLGVTRPSRQEYDALETTFGNRGWTWDRLLECMKKSENFSQPPTTGTRGQDASPEPFVPTPDPSVHGTQGPIHHSYPPSWPPRNLNVTEAEQDIPSLSKLFFQAIAQRVSQQIKSPCCNGANIGFANFLMTIDPNTCTRSSSASGYFDPIGESRSNLFVLTSALVTRVLLEKSGTSGKPRAVGVEIHVPGNQERIEVRNVRREVILSAGVYKTPEVLECSGIGDPTVLNQQGIECLVNLPGVGNNLQDHASITLIAEVDPKYVTGEILFDPVELKKHEQLYLEKKEGLLTNSLSQSIAFVPLQHVSSVVGTTPESITNQLENQNREYLMSLDLPQEVKCGFNKQYELQTNWLSDPNQAQIEIINFIGHLPVNGIGAPMPDIAAKKRYISLVACLMHPFSRGTVHHSPASLTATEAQHPGIDLNILSHPLDYSLLLEGAKYILHIAQTGPLKSALKSWVFPAELSTIDLENTCSEPDSEGNFQMEEVLENHIRNWIRTTYHPIGTAAMMPREDGGVVDDRLQVYGVEGLRVADLSILPCEISAHTVSAAYAIGEMAADILNQNHV